MVEATRPVVEGQLAQHPRQPPGRRGRLAEPGTPGGLLVGVGRLDAVGGRRRGPSRAGPALSARLRVLGSDARWASHAPPLSVPLFPAGSTPNPTLTPNCGESKACYEWSGDFRETVKGFLEVYRG